MLKVTNDGTNPLNTKVELDGVDISDYILHLDLVQDGGNEMHGIIEMLVPEIDVEIPIENLTVYQVRFDYGTEN